MFRPCSLFGHLPHIAVVMTSSFSVVLWSMMSSIIVIIFCQLKLIWTFHSIDSIIRVTLIFGNQISQPVAKVKRVSQPVISKSQSTQSNQLKIRVETNQSIQSTWLVYNPAMGLWSLDHTKPVFLLAKAKSLLVGALFTAAAAVCRCRKPATERSG